MKLNKEEILKQIDKCDEEIKAWEKINKHLWKKAYIKKRDLLIELDKAPLDKPVEVKPEEKPEVPKEPEKVYDATDVNKDGKTDLSDIIEIGKKIIRKNSKKSIKKSNR